jgi:hypothetical protein
MSQVSGFRQRQFTMQKNPGSNYEIWSNFWGHFTAVHVVITLPGSKHYREVNKKEKLKSICRKKKEKGTKKIKD